MKREKYIEKLLIASKDRTKPIKYFGKDVFISETEIYHDMQGSPPKYTFRLSDGNVVVLRGYVKIKIEGIK
jgi:hypothetical protein